MLPVHSTPLCWLQKAPSQSIKPHLIITCVHIIWLTLKRAAENSKHHKDFKNTANTHKLNQYNSSTTTMSWEKLPITVWRMRQNASKHSLILHDNFSYGLYWNWLMIYSIKTVQKIPYTHVRMWSSVLTAVVEVDTSKTEPASSSKTFTPNLRVHCTMYQTTYWMFSAMITWTNSACNTIISTIPQS